MNILFFGPFPTRSRDNESLMIKFKEMGHNVFFLNQSLSEEMADFLTRKGIKCATLNGVFKSKLELIKQIFFLRQYVSKNKIDIVFSHLEPANLVSVFTQYIIKCRFVIVRHHVDELHLIKQNKKVSYKLIYKLAKDIIVVSQRAKDFMIAEEKISSNKINVINLSYDFNLFDKPEENIVNQIRSKYAKGLLLLTASRLVESKRPQIGIEIVKQLKNSNTEAHLLIIGHGEMENELKQLVLDNQLQSHCTVLGYKKNVMDYLAAADILVNPSVMDSSSVIIKEAGWQNKVIIACKDIGDCEDYIQSGINGYLVNKNNFVNETVQIVSEQLQDKIYRDTIGQKLHLSILERFDVNTNITKYKQYIN